jgi:hypothetical protein
MSNPAGGFFGWLRKPAKPAVAQAGAAKSVRSPTPPAAPHSQQFLNSMSSQSAANSTQAIRKDLLRMVLRETLTRNGIPAAWIGADMLRTTGRGGRDTGIHVRLLMHHWDTRLLVHGVALEQNFYKRVVAMDPLAANWLMGVSWQYALDDPSACPPLPHPGSWTAMPAHERTGAYGAPAYGSADVIEGPVTVQKTDDLKLDLDRLLAAGEGNAKARGEDFAATQPIQL